MTLSRGQILKLADEYGIVSEFDITARQVIAFAEKVYQAGRDQGLDDAADECLRSAGVCSRDGLRVIHCAEIAIRQLKSPTEEKQG